MIVEYLASMTTSFTASYTVAVNGSIIGTVTQQVNNNYTPGRDALISAVAGGQV
jgi:xanthine/uracil/vitamin C permease (AzgA family)